MTKNKSLGRAQMAMGRPPHVVQMRPTREEIQADAIREKRAQVVPYGQSAPVRRCTNCHQWTAHTSGECTWCHAPLVLQPLQLLERGA